MNASMGEVRDSVSGSLQQLAIVYLAGMIIYAGVGVESTRFFNNATFELLKVAGLADGNLRENMWIGGVVEPLTSKWLPLTLIGLFGPVAAFYRVGAITIFAVVSVLIVDQLGHQVSVLGVSFVFTVGVLALLLDQRFREQKRLEFPDQYRQHPWLTGCLFGGLFGLLELRYYVVDVGTELFLRIGPLLMHTFLGGIIAGTWIILSHREKTWRNKTFAWGVIGFAIAFHVVFNAWLVHQEWYREFWSGVFALL